MLEKVIDLRCPRISLETGCTIRCVLGFAKFRGVTCLLFFAYLHDQYLLLGFSVRQAIFGPRPPYRKPVAPPLVRTPPSGVNIFLRVGSTISHTMRN